MIRPLNLDGGKVFKSQRKGGGTESVQIRSISFVPGGEFASHGLEIRGKWL